MIQKIIAELELTGCKLIESSFFPESSSHYWQTTIVDKDQLPISSGFGENLLQSRKIAIAEYVERMTFNHFKKGDIATLKKWGFHLNSMACGFAVGFNLKNTILRSLYEGIERWVLSQWIDENRNMEQIPTATVFHSLDNVSKSIVGRFDEVLYFKKSAICNFDNQYYKIDVGHVVGFKENGAYIGTSSQKTGGNLWQHALIESLRHFQMVKNNRPNVHKFPENRIRFFAENAQIAREKIDCKRNEIWELPKVIFHESQPLYDSECFIARTIVDGWRPWNEGPLDRFLY